MRGCACRLEDALLLDLRVQVGGVCDCLLSVEGLPRRDLGRQLVVEEPGASAGNSSEKKRRKSDGGKHSGGKSGRK
jgi:hypothetical protein